MAAAPPPPLADPQSPPAVRMHRRAAGAPVVQRRGGPAAGDAQEAAPTALCTLSAAAAATAAVPPALPPGEVAVPWGLPPEDVEFTSAASGGVLHFSVDPFGGGLQYACDGSPRPPFRKMVWNGTQLLFPDIGKGVSPPLDASLPRLLGQLRALAEQAGIEHSIPRSVPVAAAAARSEGAHDALRASLMHFLGSPRSPWRRQSAAAPAAAQPEEECRASDAGGEPTDEDLLARPEAAAVRERVVEWLASIPIGGNTESTSPRAYDPVPLVAFAMRRGLQDEPAEMIYAFFVDARAREAEAQAEAEEEQRRRDLAHLEEVPSAWTRKLADRLQQLETKSTSGVPLTTREEAELTALIAGFQRYIEEGLKSMGKQRAGSPISRAKQRLRQQLTRERTGEHADPSGLSAASGACGSSAGDCSFQRADEMRLWAMRAAEKEGSLADSQRGELEELEARYEDFIETGLRQMDRTSPQPSPPPSPVSTMLRGGLSRARGLLARQEDPGELLPVRELQGAPTSPAPAGGAGDDSQSGPLDRTARSVQERSVSPPGVWGREDDTRLKELTAQQEAGEELAPDEAAELAVLQERHAEFIEEGLRVMRQQAAAAQRQEKGGGLFARALQGVGSWSPRLRPSDASPPQPPPQSPPAAGAAGAAEEAASPPRQMVRRKLQHVVVQRSPAAAAPPALYSADGGRPPG
eukprot:TRINITY_DN4651_c0_g1_i1.p1 TRINITY_DN4651_c0_g1~~TRINITY_DN4651_c0_g1_i1.p1  ORF type:complete len:726 (+),score=245.35 TRINITY_DN4651_c0_g1_i1:97-2178(+)